MNFTEFPKIPRLSRECVVTEKIDGTNAQVYVVALDESPGDDPFIIWQRDGLAVFAGSRSRWITPGNDNFGFAAWVQQHAEELAGLGEGLHFGEWWGSGIQRGYGLPKGEKRFSLFNVARWGADRNREKFPIGPPACCSVVPVITRGVFDTILAESALRDLGERGSFAAPGFMRPEGIVIYHTAGNVLFKKTLDGDGNKHESDRREAK